MHWTDTHTHRSTDGWRECLMTIGCSCSIESDAQPNNHARCLFKNCASLISCNFDIQRLIFRPNHMQSISAHILTYILSWAVLFMTRSSAKKGWLLKQPRCHLMHILTRNKGTMCVHIPHGKGQFRWDNITIFRARLTKCIIQFPATDSRVSHLHFLSEKSAPPPAM